MQYNGLVKTGSQIVAVTGIVLLLDSYIDNTEDDVCIIHVADVTHKSFFDEEKIAKLREYFKKQVSISVSPQLLQEARSNDRKDKKETDPESIQHPDLIPEGRLIGQDYLYGEYLTTPFFEGKSNELAVVMKNTFIEKPLPPLYLIYGASGTGKTHLLQKTAYELKKSGHTIYLNTTKQFIDDVKTTFDKNQKSFRDILKPASYFILDDLQSLNYKHLEFIHEHFFDTLNFMKERGKKMMFAVDRDPKVLTEFAERILSRLEDGYIVEIELPGNDIKRKYLDYRLTLEEVELEEEEKNILVKTALSLRELIGKMTYAVSAKRAGLLSADSLIKRASTNKTPDEIRSEITDDQYSEAHSLLRDYYGIPAINTERERKSKAEASTIAVLIYLFKGKISRKVLMDRIGISKQLYTYYEKKGENVYMKIKPEIKKILEGLSL